MRSQPNRGNRALSIIELMVTLSIVSVILIGAYGVFTEGLQLFRTNQQAADAQTAALKVLGRIATEGVNATAESSAFYPASESEPPGVVFASTLTDTGSSRFDAVTGEVYWQKLICFYFEEDPTGGQNGKVFRVTEPLPADDIVKGPGTVELKGVVIPQVTAGVPSHFISDTSLPRRMLADGIAGFDVQLYDGAIGGAGSAATTSYEVTVEAGDRAGARRDGYYLKVKALVTPKG